MWLKKNSGGFAPAPEGLHTAVVCDVTQPKETNTGKYGVKQIFRILFEIDQLAPSGQRFVVSSPQLTPSLHEKATCRRIVEKILGRSLTDVELNSGIELESMLLGKQVNIVVEHAKSSDGTKTYANVALIQPVKTPFTAWKSNYIRFCDRLNEVKVPTAEAVANAATTSSDAGKFAEYFGKDKN